MNHKTVEDLRHLEDLGAELERIGKQYKGLEEQQVALFQQLLSEIELEASLLDENNESGEWPINYSVKRIYQTKRVAVVLIKMAQNAQIMPHNHPGMIGVMKLLKGEVSVISFKPPLTRNVQFLEQTQTLELKPGEMASLTPWRGNYHQLVAHKPALFIDVFSPDYSLWRLPTNYTITGQTSSNFVPVQAESVLKPLVKRLRLKLEAIPGQVKRFARGK